MKNNKNKNTVEAGGLSLQDDVPLALEVNIISWAKSKINANLKYIWLGSLGVLALTSLYFYWQLSSFKQNPNRVANAENEKLLADIGSLIVLPEGEVPTIATVTDTDRLKDQPFFSKAIQGDKVLLYATSKKAILYRPKKDQIIEVAPIVIGEPSKSTSPLPTPKSKSNEED